jgi:hypothetical protein
VKNPLAWSKKLYVPPSVYAIAGGWTFGPNGSRIELNYNRCFSVLPSSDDINPDTAVLVSSPRKDVCPECGSRLIDILTIDGRDDRLAFLKLDGTVRIPICPVCSTMCERTIVRYSPDGDSLTELVDPFENGNDPDEYRMPDEEYLAITAKKFALAKQPESLFFARGCDESITIGGFANWIQDFQYDPCPDCGNTMKYFASLPWSALSDYSEGTLYFEICPDCRIISVFHQQT